MSDSTENLWFVCSHVAEVKKVGFLVSPLAGLAICLPCQTEILRLKNELNIQDFEKAFHGFLAERCTHITEPNFFKFLAAFREDDKQAARFLN